MRVGDLVKIDDDHLAESIDKWGSGVIVELDELDGGYAVCVFWSKLNSTEWQMISLLEKVNESR